ncbi:MAG TPA: polysaccharide biosynthesis/export family protein [Longimicrobiales bacterium]|nr:polysaccharide biosynthesis/export family protein [Longimicrobiales bacterium]
MGMRITSLSVMVAALCTLPVHAQDSARAGWRATGIMPGDVLRMQVLREPDYSTEQTVPEDGNVVFFRLGRRDVRGLDAEELRQTLLRDYARYLRDPAIQLEVLRKVQVGGAVKLPNVYHLHPTMTISDALAMAGGTLPEGRIDRVELRRGGAVVEVLLLSERMALADTPIRSGDQLFVPQRSYVARHFTELAATATGIIALLIATMVRR